MDDMEIVNKIKNFMDMYKVKKVSVESTGISYLIDDFKNAQPHYRDGVLCLFLGSSMMFKIYTTAIVSCEIEISEENYENLTAKCTLDFGNFKRLIMKGE